MDPVGGRTRLVKDIAREHGASDRETTRAYLRVSAGHRPNALAFQDLDAYVAAWRDALIKELRAYKAAALACAQVIRARRRDEARFLATMKGAKDASQGARAPRVAAQCRAHGAPLAGALSRPRGAFVSLNLDKSTVAWSVARARARSSFDDFWLSPQPRGARLRKGPIWAYPGLKSPCSF